MLPYKIRIFLIFMKKEHLRREFIKLKCKYSYSKCQILLEKKFSRTFHISTLKRWYKRFNDGIWNFQDKSKIPNKVYYKVTQEAEKEIIELRNKTGWGALKLKQKIKSVQLSHTTINKVLKRNGLTRKEHNRGQRAKYVRFERKHSNSLWHIDDSEFGEKGKIIAVIDDATRYCLGILHVPTVTTPIVTQFLDNLIKKFGNPNQIISDNGAPYGLTSKKSKFDKWCQRRGIKHIRTRVNRPQTNGKVERLFGTIDREIRYCNNDLELFRYRYNAFRPHESLFGQTPSYEFDNFQRKLRW